jgi:hypothetical protein
MNILIIDAKKRICLSPRSTSGATSCAGPAVEAVLQTLDLAAVEERK